MADQAGARFRAFEHESWERAAPYYADSFARFTAPFATPLLAPVGCRAGARLLDVACGTGYISHVAASLGAMATGIDFSAGMVAEATRRHPSASFAVADAGALPFGEESFDAVVAGFGVQHFSSPTLAMAEARRVLRPGGTLAFTVWASPGNSLQQVLIDGITLSGRRGSSIPAPPEGEVNSGETCLRLLAAAGFRASDCSARKVEIRLPVASAARLLDIHAKGTARGAAMLRAQPETLMPSVLASVEKAMAPYRSSQGQGYEVPAVAILAVATRG